MEAASCLSYEIAESYLQDLSAQVADSIQINLVHFTARLPEQTEQSSSEHCLDFMMPTSIVYFFYTETNGYQCCYWSSDRIKFCPADGGKISSSIYIGSFAIQIKQRDFFFFESQNSALSQRSYLKQKIWNYFQVS